MWCKIKHLDLIRKFIEYNYSNDGLYLTYRNHKPINLSSRIYFKDDKFDIEVVSNSGLVVKFESKTDDTSHTLSVSPCIEVDYLVYIDDNGEAVLLSGVESVTQYINSISIEDIFNNVIEMSACEKVDFSIYNSRFLNVEEDIYN